MRRLVVVRSRGIHCLSSLLPQSSVRELSDEGRDIRCPLAPLVAICWGLYGPTLTNARAANREWGPFKPYVFIGVAYLVIAIAGGAAMMKLAYNDNFDYSGKYLPAMKWGFLAGCLGALAAPALTFALTKAGGKPAYVMPIVFGRRRDGQRDRRLLESASRRCGESSVVGRHGLGRRWHLFNGGVHASRPSAVAQTLRGTNVGGAVGASGRPLAWLAPAQYGNSRMYKFLKYNSLP